MKLCDTCIYRNNVEQSKPCIIYRDDCEYYEKERDMTREEAIEWFKGSAFYSKDHEPFNMAIQALEQEPIDKSAMMYDIYMEGVNMTGEYQGCWVKFKDIEKIVDKYMGDKE